MQPNALTRKLLTRKLLTRKLLTRKLLLAVAAAAVIFTTLPPSPMECGAASVKDTIPRHERGIEHCRTKIKDYEAILHEYAAEFRKTRGDGPHVDKRRTELRIIKRHYVREIEALRQKIVEHYRKIKKLKSGNAPAE